jgi:bud site selection protein 31
LHGSAQVIEDFESQMKEAVNEDQEGKRKSELTWKIHRLHWEKNRFIYDLMYMRKVMIRWFGQATACGSIGARMSL